MTEQPIKNNGATDPTQTPVTTQRTSRLAIWAIVLAVLGVLFFPIGMVGGVLGIMALVKIRKNPMLEGQVIAIIAIVLTAVMLLVNLLLVSIAIPAFLNYVRRAKTNEATMNLNTIFRGIDAYYQKEGNIVSIPLTPSEVPCAERRTWTEEELSRFAVYDFRPAERTFYSYEVVNAPSHVDGALVVIRARGDLDCDGEHSLFELAITDDGEGGTRRQPIYIENEIE